MATLVVNKKGLLKQMLAKKRQIEAHLKKPNEVPKTEGIEFVKPFTGYTRLEFTDNENRIYAAAIFQTDHPQQAAIEGAFDREYQAK